LQADHVNPTNIHGAVTNISPSEAVKVLSRQDHWL